MSANTLLVDPLAALFRPALSGLPPLVLDDAEIEVQLCVPLAVIVAVRRFTNNSDRLIEAVLTLPPIAPDEVLYRLLVRIGGVDYQGVPQSARRARREHDVAIANGQRAILYELLGGRIPLVSIAGIEPATQVEVVTWSVKPVTRLAGNTARLDIALGAGSDASAARLGHADAIVTTAERHAASLRVSAEALQVTISGQPYPDQILQINEAIGVECGTPIVLDIMALKGRSLDRSEWQVDKSGGWEVTSERSFETFRHPTNPGGRISSDRDDWIYGRVSTATGIVKVTAPLHDDGNWWGVAPVAQGMRAFAATGFVEAATPQTGADVLRAANVLTRKTSLVFIGPEGELPDEIPQLRKLALAAMDVSETSVPSLPQLEPVPEVWMEPPQEPDLPVKESPIMPGAGASRRDWLTWMEIPFLVALLVTAWWLNLPVTQSLAVFAVAILLVAMRFRPARGTVARRRSPLLVLLALPPVASFLGGPLPWQMATGDMARIADWMIPFQLGMSVSALLLPIALVIALPGARHFVLVLGLLAVVLTFLLAATSIITLSPGA